MSVVLIGTFYMRILLSVQKDNTVISFVVVVVVVFLCVCFFVCVFFFFFFFFLGGGGGLMQNIPLNALICIFISFLEYNYSLNEKISHCLSLDENRSSTNFSDNPRILMSRVTRKSVLRGFRPAPDCTATEEARALKFLI